ncbi:MAG TPA: serine/threonine-protein kinase [Myxococcaceae bacterium]|nr:serine/threonine-protein kinase [Myxococcaceae bacterium]
MVRTPEGQLPQLSPGAQVGNWRIEARHGQGAYGTVYRAVSVNPECPGPVALKVALYPWNARFVREAELLSRLSCPGVPRLLDSGVLRHASSDDEYAWFVMEWVEGTPLYAWGAQQQPSYREVCRVLAQLARTLEAIHAAGAVHRDVKGDNVLVQLSDRSPVLLDFGSGHYKGASRLTWQALAPGTPAYLSAQACAFEISLARNRDGYYAPAPADDLFALGVTAYRLVMGQYPPPMDVQEQGEDGEGGWRVSSPDPRALLEANPRLQPVLREWIRRLLSDVPEERGTAARLAEALEAEAREQVKELPPATAPATQETRPAVLPGHDRPRSPARGGAPWLVLAVAGVCAVLLWNRPPAPVPPGHVAVSPPQASQAHAPDAGTAAVGDSEPAEPEDTAQSPTEDKPVAQEPSTEPQRGLPRQQVRADAKGRCPGRTQVAIDGACWVESRAMTEEECTQNGYLLRKGKCYGPAMELPRKAVPTSGPSKPR